MILEPVSLYHLDYFIRKNQQELAVFSNYSPTEGRNNAVSVFSIGNTKEKLTRKITKVCYKCKETCITQKHHILYRPELLSLLCIVCHKEVTYLNGLMATYWARALSNLDRVKIYEKFLLETKGVWLVKAEIAWESR